MTTTTKNARQLSLINFKAKAVSKIKAPRSPKTKGARKSKTFIMVEMLSRTAGVTLEQLAEGMSKFGSTCTASYVKSWIHYDLKERCGFGIRSERLKNGRVRCFIIDPRVKKAPKPKPEQTPVENDDANVILLGAVA